MIDAEQMLREGATLVLSVSGGKDSDAMSHYLLGLREAERWPGEAVMVHADLGRAEWGSTPAYVAGLAERKGVPLHVVRWSSGDLIDRIWQRYHADPNRPCWPSAKMRYCTSDLKRGPISRWIRNYCKEGQVVCAMGLRAQESTARARKVATEIRQDCTSEQVGRKVINWLPIHTWTEEDVWSTIRTHGDIYHEAYDYGNQRLSCALCVLATSNDLLNGAEHNPETYRQLCEIEAVTGYSFRQGFWLSDLRPDLLPSETLTAVAAHKEKA